MKTLLFLNGPQDWQTGIEDGFTYLKNIGKIQELKWFYFEDFEKKTSSAVTLKKIKEIASEFQPNLIVFFHISSFSVSKSFLLELKNLSSKPIIAYDEGDMYGGWAKPITRNMKLLMKFSNVISIRGLGNLYKKVKKINKNIIYTPHHADIARFDTEPYILKTRQNDILFIGNRIKSRFWGNLKRISGAKRRDDFVKNIGLNFPEEFALFGNGWNGFIGDRGPVPFQQQLTKYKDSWITVSYEHYPGIPYYFSNRLPISLMSGSLYVCHYHKGYEKIFNEGDFIFFFRENEEAVDIIKFLQSLNKEEILERSKRARAFALKNFTPEVVWGNFYSNVLNELGLLSEK